MCTALLDWLDSRCNTTLLRGHQGPGPSQCSSRAIMVTTPAESRVEEPALESLASSSHVKHGPSGSASKLAGKPVFRGPRSEAWCFCATKPWAGRRILEKLGSPADGRRYIKIASSWASWSSSSQGPVSPRTVQVISFVYPRSHSALTI